MTDSTQETADEFAALTDQALIAEWLKTNWDSDPARVGALVAELDRREIEF